MKAFFRILSVFLIIVMLPVSGLAGCTNRKSVVYKDIGKSAVITSKEIVFPDRPYVIESETDPENLAMQDFLVSDNITIKSFLLSSQLKESLMGSTTLTDLVHSRSEMEGLKTFQTEVKALLSSYGQQQVLGLSGMNLTTNELRKIDAKITSLFSSKPGVISVYNGPIKGTWTTPDKVILRWTPEDEWIPESGYDVFRTINGKTEKIATGLGNENSINQLAGKLAAKGLESSDIITDIYNNARLDDTEINALGYKSLEEFNSDIYSKAVVNSTKTRIMGDQDFKLSRDSMLSVPGSIEAKVPASDAYASSSFHLAKDIDALPTVLLKSISGVKANISGNMSPGSALSSDSASSFKKLSTVDAGITTSDNVLGSKEMKLSEIMDARNNIITKALIDPEFAGSSGLGYEDNLENQEGLNVNDPVNYSVVPVGTPEVDLHTLKKLAAGEELDKEYKITIRYGVETPVGTPQGLDGYGMDNVVSLRWQAPTSDYDRSIISGYNIERKKKGEAEYSKINDLPVAITYNEDEDGILFEVPIFFVDSELKNGEEASYRIHALDVFGRFSEYSTALDIKVCKVAPPTAPSVGQPDLSAKVKKERSPLSYSDVISYNSKKKGVILPISRVTNDTNIFVIYRCKAYGTGSFDTPEELVRINVEPYMVDDVPRVATNINKTKFLIRPKTPAKVDTLFYDSEIEPGYYYKYWVSAVDSWGNESDWSESKTIGYPLDEAPAEALSPEASMKKNSLVSDKSSMPAGFFERFTKVQSGNKTAVSNQAKLAGPLQVSTDTSTGDTFSESLSLGMAIPDALSLLKNNLPNARDIHDIIVLKGEDLEPDGSASVSWYHYSGSGVAGYLVYRAYSDNKTLEDISGLTEEGLVQNFLWTLVGNNVQSNQITDKVEEKDGRLYLYMVCLLPDEIDTPELNGFRTFLPAGWIMLEWDRPDDQQVSYYRVYRAEVPYFKDNEKMSDLEWMMVADHIKYNTYSEKVDQTYAHYYYFKVVSVSTWGVDAKEGSITQYRVPATSPPQVPTMLMPFSKKAVNTVHWVGVPHASKYEIYRYMVPRVQEADIQMVKQLAPEVFETLFSQKFVNNIYYANPDKTKTAVTLSLGTGLRKSATAANAAVAGKFKTLQLKTATEVKSSMQSASLSSKLDVYSKLVDKYGVLAVSPYSELDMEAAMQVLWKKVGEVNIAQGEESSGELSFADSDVLFGNTYLYTVQAWNDDNLGSNKPEPVSVFTRKGEAFPPVTNLSWENSGGKPLIKWYAAKDPNLTTKESKEYIAGYILYRSNTQNGPYYQASGLIPNDETSYKDENANLTAENWYKVKVVDTAGYISEFSEAVIAKIEPKNMIPNNKFRTISSTYDLNDAKGSTTVAMNDQTEKTVSRGSIDSDSRRLVSEVKTSRQTYASIIRPTSVPTLPPIIIKTFKPFTFAPSTPAPTEYTRPTPTPTPAPTTSYTRPPTTMSTTAAPTSTPKPTASPSIVVPSIKPNLEVKPGTFISDTMLLNGFTISDISIAGMLKGSGEGTLNMEGGWQIPVYVTINKFNGNVITDGAASQKAAVTIGSTGVYIKTIKLLTQGIKSTVSGYVKRESGNMLGDMLTLDLNESAITPIGVIHVTDIPVFHYENLTFTGISKISINLNSYASTGTPTAKTAAGGNTGLKSVVTYGTGFINLHSVTVETSMGLETVNNKGFEFSNVIAGFDSQGRLSGSFKLVIGKYSQGIRTVIPAGLYIAAKNAALVYSSGSIDTAGSFINGKVMTPFSTFKDEIPKDPDSISIIAAKNVTLDRVRNITNLSTSSGSSASGATLATTAGLTAQEVQMVNGGLCYMAELAQSNALLVAPEALEDTNEIVSSIPYSVKNWDGKGFIIEETTMTPTLVGQTPLSTIFDTGSSEALGATPGKVAVDLTRETVYNGDAPEDTKLPEWMGVVVKYGNVSLPPSYVQTDAGKRVRFNVEDGELLYDQNGFFYQNQAYTPEGVSANFGEALGGFTDVMIFNIVIDLYNNITNMQIEGDVAVPMLNSRLKVSIYTDEDKGNKLVCSVLETDKFDPSGKGKLKMKVLNGYLDEKGMHIDGTIDMGFEKEKMTLKDMQFTELMIPSDVEKVKVEDEASEYGRALFDKPYLVEFHDFPMEVRALSMITALTGNQITNDTYSGTAYDTTMTLWGGMQLSDNLPSDANQDVDRIIIGASFNNPEFRYNDSKSAINMDFEDFAKFDGVGTPLPPSGDDGIVEYDTSGLEAAFNGAADFGDSPIQVNARIGYDKKMSRSFFAIAIYYSNPTQGISFTYGEINDITGMIGYNLDLDKNEDGTFNFSNEKDSLFASLDGLAVNRTSEGNYFFALSACMYLKYGALCLGQVRNMYIIVEKGPTVEMGGFFFGPTSVAGLYGTDNDSLEKMGTVRMGYYHDRRLFQFSLTLDDFGMYGFYVNGDIGFEICPDYWDFRVGYPTALSASFGGFGEVWFGVALRYSQIDESYIKAQGGLSFDTGDITLGIVYVRGYLGIGADGYYLIDSQKLYLHAYLYGGIEGGVKAMGKRFRVISLMLNAEGTLENTSGWHLDASARISYHVDLWLTDIGGSVGWHISKDL